MQAKLVTYDIKNLNNYQKSRLTQKLYGYIDKSCNGSYVYNRSGLLDNIDHIKVSQKTIIVKKRDYVLVEKEIVKYGAKPRTWDITIEKI